MLPKATPTATAEEITRAQAVVGTLLYNAHAVDPTLLAPLSALVSQLSTVTTTTIAALSHLLDYCSTHPESTIRYFASDMQLKIHSNAKEGTVTRTTLTEMDHIQDATELKTDNTTVDGIINNTVQQKRSKAMDMRFYWVKDRVEQGQFNIG
jgi:hypothetical protein